MSITPGPWKFKYHVNVDGIGTMEAEFDVKPEDLNVIANAQQMYELIGDLYNRLLVLVDPDWADIFKRVDAILRRIEEAEAS